MKNKIGILIESDFYENEIFYYQFRFKEAGYEVHFLSRLWGNNSITFNGHEFRAPFYCNESFETLTDKDLDEYAAIIVPAGMVRRGNATPHTTSWTFFLAERGCRRS